MSSTTDYQAKYIAHELTRRFPSDEVDKLASALVDAQVDLNPHQVDAALFAFRSPLSRGALLADEVGLGKTIEAGLVLAQRWAEHRRRVLVITPANLRKQWYQELTEKFFLPCRILEARSYAAAVKGGDASPFAAPEVVICSYEFARGKEREVALTPWDLVVVDEAHRLRNVYKPSNVTANALKRALAGRHKLLLTATPLQNSLLELYGLVSFIDEHTFGDLASFREQFAAAAQTGALGVLKRRLEPICHRTLRRQVTAYVPYTKRLSICEDFTPEANEARLYELVSEYLQRDNLQALPSGQRSLMTLVLRKLLASSSFAIAGALRTMADRLRARLQQRSTTGSLEDQLDEDYEALDETAEEWGAETDDAPLTSADRAAVEREVADLDHFAELATSIEQNAKGRALLSALARGFAQARALGASEKAIIFTESRRTQDYLLRVLADAGFGDDVVLFNGSNTDAGSKAVYAAWLDRHRGTDRVTGSRTADMRSALVDEFRERARIMIATEAGAEGINLQFCSLVVNYDLPWNPQRVEQRIGRCHRYGQQHDVVVVNFVNRKNAADERVFELLSEKFKLFDGVFGASDEVLGALGSGVDFEKRIAEIYQRCRRPDEIKSAFDQLQRELSGEIAVAMTDVQRKLLEHFDDEVRDRLRTRDRDSRRSLGRFEEMLMRLTRHELAGSAAFDADGAAFDLAAFDPAAFDPAEAPSAGGDVPLGRYELPRRSGEAHYYRLGHPLAQAVLARAKGRALPPAAVEFDYSGRAGKVSVLAPLVGCSGWLAVSCLTVASLDRTEDHLLTGGVLDAGGALGEEQARRMLGLDGRLTSDVAVPADVAERIAADTAAAKAAVERRTSERNAEFFEAEAAKLDGWADDLKVGLERELKEIDRQIKEARRTASAAATLEAKVAGQKDVRALESRRNERRRSLFDEQDRIDCERERLITQIEDKMTQRSTVEPLFTIRWSVR